jgi:REP element-mobilizing transposase RayT
MTRVMPRRRKPHVQQSIRFPDKNGQQRGRRKGERWRGKRPGRPPKNGKRAGSPHKTRPELKEGCPVHVVLRVHEDVHGLRNRDMYRALREATITAALREQHFATENAFRIVHISIQHNHVHMIVEASSKTALSRGMQGFQISAAKHINAAFSKRKRLRTRRRGPVFPDRYHQEIITSPRQARHTLTYVLNNWRKHREDRTRAARSWKVDPFSTGVLFEGWKGREEPKPLWKWPDKYEPLVVYLPQSWLLRTGWMKHGRIAFHEVPSTPRAPAPMASAQ